LTALTLQGIEPVEKTSLRLEDPSVWGTIMSQLLRTLGLTCAVIGIAGWAMAQNASMPGQVVSNTTGEHLRFVGNELPQAAKPVGKPINLPNNNPLFRPYNPANPYEALQGTGMSVKSVVAPVNGYTNEAPQSMFQQITNNMKSLLGLTTPPIIHNTYTPGIFRRDRQRVKERMWVKD
jgi:hypothetical protein